MAKYILRDGELYSVKTGHKMPKRKIDKKGRFAKEYWHLYIDGKVRAIQVCAGKEKELLEMYHVDYIEE